MNLPKVRFLKESELETSLAHHLCYLGKQIACGYYQQRRFLLLPKIVPNYGRAVYFPDLAYPKFFWHEVTKYAQNDFKFRFEDKVYLAAKELLISAHLTPISEEITQVEKNWQSYEKPFFEAFKDMFPLFDLSKITSIDCTVSKIGTQGSFEFQNNKDGTYAFKFTHRLDVPISGIAEKIVTEFVYKDNPILSLGEWEIRENMVDFVLLKTKIGQIFDFDFQPTVANLPELSENQVLASDTFFKKVGFPVESVFSLKGDQILLGDVTITKAFTQTEYRIFKCLIESKDQIKSYDEIGNLFWGEEASLEKFSLVSIAKIMEKIRRKIKEHGIYQEMIYTIRGQGYVLYD